MYHQSNNGHHQGPPPSRGGFNQGSNQYGQSFSQQPRYGQQPPFGHQQYGQSGYQSGHQQGAAMNRGGHHSNTYPPPKRQKGNPVITRYAPPPGYQAPPTGQPWQAGGFRGANSGVQQGFQQSGPSFQRPSGPPNFQNGWQPQSAQFGGGQMYQSPQGYNNPPQNFPPSHQQGPQSYSQSGYAQQQGYQHQQHQAGNFGSVPYPQGQAQQAQGGYQQQRGSWQGSPSQQNAFPAKPDGFNGSPHHGSPSRRDQGSQSGRASVGSIGSMPPPPLPGTNGSDINMDDHLGMSAPEPDPNDPLNMKEHDWTFDPEGAIWPKATEMVDTRLSLGLIAWHPGNRMTRAVPSTFDAAEIAARSAPPPLIGLGDSVSTYFTKENHEHAYEDIRSLRHWSKVKNDPVFVEFPEEYESVDVPTVKAWRDRADVVVEILDEAEEEGEIDMDAGSSMIPSNGFNQQSQPGTDQPDTNLNHQASDRDHKRVDQSQEDILASLGVEGPARPVYPTPGPAYGTQSTGKANSVEFVPQRKTSHVSNLGHTGSNALAHGSMQLDNQGPANAEEDPIEQAIARAIAGNPPTDQKSTPPPPPEPIEQDSQDPEPYDPWNPDQGMPVPRNRSPRSGLGQDATAGASINGHSQSPPTMRMDEDLKQPIVRHESSASRKRSYDNFNDRDASDEDRKRRQSEDGSRRPSKSKHPSDDAYSRRW